MPKDTDHSQPSGKAPSGKASVEKIRADLHAAGLMRLLETPPDRATKVLQKQESNVVPFRRREDRHKDRVPVRPVPAPMPARRNWRRPVATLLYMSLAAAIAYLTQIVP